MALDLRASEVLAERSDEILESWSEKLRDSASEAGWAGQPEEVLRRHFKELLGVFVEFVRSEEDISTFSRQGETRSLVRRVAAQQDELGRDAVQVVSDYLLLRRAVWEHLERHLELGSYGGSEVSALLGKVMEAMDWVIGAGGLAFDALQRAAFEDELGAARSTDLITGLPDRVVFDRKLLPEAIRGHDTFAVVVFDIDRFSETVAHSGIETARGALVTLAEAVRMESPEDCHYCRFGDDEICVILPGFDSERAYGVAEGVLRNIADRSKSGGVWDLNLHAGIAEYPSHGRDANQIVFEVTRALRLAKRIEGSGIMVSR